MAQVSAEKLEQTNDKDAVAFTAESKGTKSSVQITSS